MQYFRNIMMALAVALGPAGAARAQESVPERPLTNEEKIEQLDQQIKVIQRLREIEKEEADKKAKEGSKATASAKDGFTLQTNNKEFVLKFALLLHADDRVYFEDESKNVTNTFLLRRIRPTLQGTVFKYVDFRVTPEFAGSAVSILDAYVDLAYFKEAKIRIGRYKGPVGLERLQSGGAISFVERALPTNLVPNRDIGIQLFGELFDGKAEYAVGLFNAAPDGANTGDTDVNEDKEFQGRVFLTPFKDSDTDLIRGLGFGIGGSWGEQGGTNSATGLPTYRSNGQANIFSYRAGGGANNTVYSAGPKYRVAPQGYWYYGPFGVLAEYTRSTHEVELNNPPAQKGKFTHHAWQTAVSWVVTGEEASFKGVRPKTDLSFTDGTWGAVELVARYNELRVDKKVFPVFADATRSVNRARGFALGANWYLNRYTKIQVDYEQTDFDGGAVSVDREDEKVLFSRVQLSF